MTVLLALILAALHVEYDYLVALYEGTEYLTNYLCACYSGSTYCDCAFVVGKKYFVELYALSLLCVLDVVHEELLSCLGLELLALNFYNCVHFNCLMVVPGGADVVLSDFYLPFKDFAGAKL